MRDAGAPLDLGEQAASIAQREAQRVDDPQVLGAAAFGLGHGLLAAGAFDLATQQLDLAGTAVSTVNTRGVQLAGMAALTMSLLAAARRDQTGVPAPLEPAARTG